MAPVQGATPMQRVPSSRSAKRGLLRDKISALERELLQEVYEDPRFKEGPSRVAMEIRRRCFGSSRQSRAFDDESFGSDEDSEGLADSGCEGFDVSIVEKVITNWSTSCVQICMDDWECEHSLHKLQQSRKLVEKLDWEKADAHRCYMQELSSLRERIARLEKKTPIDWSLDIGDLIFYEPTRYLTDELREMVRDIVTYKVKSELLSVGGSSGAQLQDKSEAKDYKQECMARAREKEVKEMKKRIAELEAQLAGSKSVVEDMRSTQDTAPSESRRRLTLGMKEEEEQEDPALTCRRCSGPLPGVVDPLPVRQVSHVGVGTESLASETQDAFEQTRRPTSQGVLLADVSSALGRSSEPQGAASSSTAPAPGGSEAAAAKDQDVEALVRDAVASEAAEKRRLEGRLSSSEGRVKELEEQLQKATMRVSKGEAELKEQLEKALLRASKGEAELKEERDRCAAVAGGSGCPYCCCGGASITGKSSRSSSAA